MSFIWPRMLLSLLMIPLLVGLYFRLQRRREQAVTGLGPLGVVLSGSGSPVGWQRHLPPTLFLSSLALLLFGLARPEMPITLPRIEGTVILAFDISNSMTADDLEPTRIEAAKAAARAFVDNQPSTILIGIVAFSNGGLVVQQPTDDQGAVLATIDRLSPQGGTSLGQGIFASLNAIAGEALSVEDAVLGEDARAIQLENYSSAVVVLLTDGENTEPPDPLEIAQLAAEAGVRIYPVGIGSSAGTIVQVDGFNILTQLNEPILQEIASLTNGQYFQAENEESLKEIYENVDLQLTIEGETTEVTSIIAGMSMLLLLLGGIFSLLWFGRLP